MRRKAPKRDREQWEPSKAQEEKRNKTGFKGFQWGPILIKSSMFKKKKLSITGGGEKVKMRKGSWRGLPEEGYE